MILKVNPTRINLLRLKKDLKTAEKGYKLLKDKRDGLMRTFMEIIRETRDLRTSVNKELREALASYIKASSILSPKTIENAFMLPSVTINLSVKTQSVMSVPIARFSLEQDGQAFSYGFLETTGDLDAAVLKLQSVFPSLIRLAELEKTVESLAYEIERTRRRTSALENIMIPNLKETVRFINLRLEEQARDTIVGTMRIKAMIEAAN